MERGRGGWCVRYKNTQREKALGDGDSYVRGPDTVT